MDLLLEKQKISCKKPFIPFSNRFTKLTTLPYIGSFFYIMFKLDLRNCLLTIQFQNATYANELTGR